MARIVRTVTKRIFIIINLVVVVLFLLACLNGHLRPEKWWFFSLLGLLFPVLLFLVAGFVIFWSLFRSQWVILPLIALVLGFTNIRVFLGFWVCGFHPVTGHAAWRDSDGRFVWTGGAAGDRPPDWTCHNPRSNPCGIVPCLPWRHRRSRSDCRWRLRVMICRHAASVRQPQAWSSASALRPSPGSPCSGRSRIGGGRRNGVL